MLKLLLCLVFLATPALAEMETEMGFRNHDGSQDTVYSNGTYEMEFRNSDGSVDKVRSDGAYGMGFRNSDGSQDTVWSGGAEENDSEDYDE